MRRLPPAAVLLLALAGCAAPGGPAPSSTPVSATARFVPGGESTVVEVTVNDRRALRSAELLGPNGIVLPAESLTTAQSPRSDTTYTSGPGFGSGAGMDLSAVANPLGAPRERTTYLGQTLSTALIRLPDPVLYRKTWQDWRVRLEVGVPPNGLQTVELPAPAPPAP